MPNANVSKIAFQYTVSYTSKMQYGLKYRQKGCQESVYFDLAHRLTILATTHFEEIDAF
jgi:hypothetical protein